MFRTLELFIVQKTTFIFSVISTAIGGMGINGGYFSAICRLCFVAFTANRFEGCVIKGVTIMQVTISFKTRLEMQKSLAKITRRLNNARRRIM